MTKKRIVIKCHCGNMVTITRAKCRCCCGATLYAEDSEPKWQPGAPCANRGEVLREIECKCAGGRLLVDVYTCEVHEECTLRNTRAGHDKPHVCLGCDDWQAIAPEQTSP